MKSFRLKTASILCAMGLFVGMAGLNHSVEAKDYSNKCAVSTINNNSKADIALIAKTFNINEKILNDYYKKGCDLNDLKTGAFLAYTSNQSFDKVIGLHKERTWNEVAGALNLSNYDIKSNYDDFVATYLANQLDFNKSVMTFLLEQNYTPQQIIYASLYSMYISKSPADLIEAYNKQTDSWDSFIAKQGVSQKQIQEVNNKVKSINQDILNNDFASSNCQIYCPCK